MTDLLNPPAFPCEAIGDRSVPPEHDHIQTGIHASKFPGMSLRDYFAGQALAGLTTATDSAGTWQTVGAEINAAVAAYAFADAMLAEREKGGAA